MKILYKNKKGFTLIELLGVIVILGIIALIAVPTVKTIMDESKKKSFTNSAYGIIKAGDLYYARKDMLDEIEGDITFEFPNNAEELELQGELPEQGTMTINKKGDISLVISNGDYCITKGFDDKDIKVTEDVGNCKVAAPGSLAALATTGYVTTMSISTSTSTSTSTATSIATSISTELVEIPSCVTDGSECASGTPVAIKVNESETYGFYVIEDNGTEVTLIMDRNLGDYVEWYADAKDNSYGPTTAVAALKERTSGWTNIPEKEYTYSDDGGGNKYTAFTETMRARMLTYTEATTFGCTSSCPSWLYVNLKNTGSDTDGSGNTRYGYWTSAAYASSSNYAHSVSSYGNVAGSNTYDTNNGVRPVITLTK